MMFRLLGLVLVLLAMTSTSYAGQYVSGSTIKSVWAGYSDGYILFETNEGLSNPNSCSGGQYYAMDQGSADVDSALAILLSAQARGAKINFVIDTSKCQSQTSKPLVLRLGVYSD